MEVFGTRFKAWDLLQIQLFGCGGVILSKSPQRGSLATFPGFLLGFLASLKNLNFRDGPRF